MNFMEKVRSGIYFIAEMSANHAGELENALAIVRAAKEAGADCLKIQTYTADTITLNSQKEYFRIREGLWKGYTLYGLYSEAFTPWEWHEPIQEECERQGLDFLSTPFDESAVDFLEGLGVGAYKIASFELVHIPLIEYAASKGRPMLLSTGMGSEEEIEEAVQACRRQGNEDVILLKCTSEYPARYQDMNLSVLTQMRRRFGVRVGLSDHSMGSLAPVAAASLGACVIEKHFCLSRKLESADCAFSMEPEEYRDMVADVRNAQAALGSPEFTVSADESLSFSHRRSVFSAKEIRRGEILTKDNLRIVRPGQGLPPKYWNEVLGKRARRDIEFAEPIQWEDLE
ncbi:MAG: pseudaminic acid synthase [Clostridium sp.]|jgi:pseudaminic acid synthase|nr:pseudaminic acid synthase [Clostridium sp.]